MRSQSSNSAEQAPFAGFIVLIFPADLDLGEREFSDLVGRAHPRGLCPQRDFRLGDRAHLGGRRDRRGFGGADQFGLWLLRLAAVALAIYPAFVLRQGDACSQWQNPSIIPLIAASAFHSGLAAFFLAGSADGGEEKFRVLELVLGIIQLAALALALRPSTAPVAFGVALLACLAALRLPARVPITPLLRHLAALVGAFAIRYWLIAVGHLA